MKVSKKKKQDRKKMAFVPPVTRSCVNCGERGGVHFVPPSLGDPGFFHCEQKDDGVIPDDHISAMWVDVYQFSDDVREKLRANFPINYVRRAWIPQTMGDGSWSFFGFLCTADRVGWEQSLPKELHSMLNREHMDVIRKYGWGVRDMNGFIVNR